MMPAHDEQETCACGGNCACGGHHEQQVYLTREDYVARLKQYLVELKDEIQSVEQELAELTKEAA
jgi:hypothetical protein